MTIREFIQKNIDTYTVIDVNKGDIHYDTANGFTTTKENENVLNEDISAAYVKELSAKDYINYLGAGTMEDYGYNINDKFCTIEL